MLPCTLRIPSSTAAVAGLKSTSSRVCVQCCQTAPASLSRPSLLLRSSEEQLNELLDSICDHGAVRVNEHDCKIETADIKGAFPEGFYSTTNYETKLRLSGEWVTVDQPEMDCGVVVTPDQTSARCLTMTEVRTGDLIVVGHVGVRATPEERLERGSGFEFMDSAVSDSYCDQ